jgi:Phosphotransferase enzyme family
MVETTHGVQVAVREVIKTFGPTYRDEARREWEGLRLLDRHAPGLAPAPRRFENAGDRAVGIAMSRLRGKSLGTDRLSPEQVAAVGEAMRTVFAAVPDAELADLPERRSGSRELAAHLRSWCRDAHEPTAAAVDSALADARRWLESPETIALTEGALVDRVFGLGDGNIGNFIWDGARCRVVDFEDCGVSDPVYEVADVVEHATVSLSGFLDADGLVAPFGFTSAQRRRLLQYRRLMATFWLLMLLPGNPGHRRNPAGSVDRQADRVRSLLDRVD